jgi:hypothetical protein
VRLDLTIGISDFVMLQSPVLLLRAARSGRETFGFSPKISTTVENTVENGIYAELDRLFARFT